ncbi:MAG: hypothetical protein HGB11_13075, partial [Chlorobiales bacterium]|nr:hypothetical protein [Chlorobiales bacterium]
MMKTATKSNHVVGLRQGSRKDQCPGCKRHSFKPYVRQDGSIIDPSVGSCDHTNSCGYHLKPRNFYALTGKKSELIKPNLHVKLSPPEPEPYYLNDHYVKSLTRYDLNSLYKFISKTFGHDKAQEAFARFPVGTSGHTFKNPDYPGQIIEGGAFILYRIDQHGNVRRGKVMQIDELTGKRMKWPNGDGVVSDVHVLLSVKQKDWSIHKRQPRECLFGLHQIIRDENSPIAICEGEKTAVIASIRFPRYLWMATGSVSSLTLDRLEPLRGRKIVLYPDLGAYQKWVDTSKEFKGFDISVSTLLEEIATPEEREAGLDIADFLIKELREKPAETRTELEPPFAPPGEKAAVCEPLPDTTAILDDGVKAFLVANTRPH